MTGIFNSIPHSPRSHFQLHFYGAILRLMGYIERMSALGGESLAAFCRRYPFLSRYREEIDCYLPDAPSAGPVIGRWNAGIAAWEEGCPFHLPLAALGRREEVGPQGLAAFLLAGIVEEDSRFGTLLARLQEPLAARRPTLELIGQAISSENQPGEGRDHDR